jgi:hypothetical protein
MPYLTLSGLGQTPDKKSLQKSLGEAIQKLKDLKKRKAPQAQIDAAQHNIDALMQMILNWKEPPKRLTPIIVLVHPKTIAAPTIVLPVITPSLLVQKAQIKPAPAVMVTSIIDLVNYRQLKQAVSSPSFYEKEGLVCS